MTLVDSTLSGNRTAGDDARGGGIHADTVRLEGSTVTGGFSSGGGGIVAGNEAVLVNSTVSGNIGLAGSHRSAAVDVRFGEARLVNSTVSGNLLEGAFETGVGLAITAGTLSLVTRSSWATPVARTCPRSRPARSAARRASSAAIPA